MERIYGHPSTKVFKKNIKQKLTTLFIPSTNQPTYQQTRLEPSDDVWNKYCCDSCAETPSEKILCKTKFPIEKVFQDVSNEISRYPFQKIYLATSPHNLEEIEYLRKKLEEQHRRVKLYTIHDLVHLSISSKQHAGSFDREEETRFPWLNTNYQVSLIEQEICLYADSFLGSSSTWSAMVVLQRRAQYSRGKKQNGAGYLHHFNQLFGKIKP